MRHARSVAQKRGAAWRKNRRAPRSGPYRKKRGVAHFERGAKRGANIEVFHNKQGRRRAPQRALSGRLSEVLRRPTALRAVAHANREDNDMTDAREEISATFKVGARYRCSITLPLQKCGMTLHVEWQPDVPGRLTDAELRDYRDGRDALLKEAANLLGISVLVTEI